MYTYFSLGELVNESDNGINLWAILVVVAIIALIVYIFRNVRR